MKDRRIKSKKVIISGRRSTDLAPTVLSHQFVAEEIARQFLPLQENLTKYVNEDAAWKNEDAAWKVRAEPMLKAFENTNWAFRIFVTTVKLVSLVAGAVVSVGGAWILVNRYLK